MAVTSTIADVLFAWIGHQRWFTGKGTQPRLRITGALEFGSDQELRVTTYLIADDSTEPAVLYQVPVTNRRTPLESAGTAHIGMVADRHGEPWQVYDGPHDPAFATRLLRLITTGASIDGDGVSAHGVSAHGASADGARTSHPLFGSVRSQVLRGEQSNTSIVYTFDGDGTSSEQPVICKIFRTLHHGENPDVVLQTALFAAGSHSVPATVGHLVGEWADPAKPSGRAHGHLAFAQEFIEGAEDAWRLALAAAASAADFRANARQIGIATADIHSRLASAFPTRNSNNADIAGAVAGWRERLDAAIRELPGLAALRQPIEALYARAQSMPWPRLQRIHGDLHLGQILAVSGGLWAIIDFEGEPMRPLAARSLADVPLRDVAGMLRSFDYVAGAQHGAPGIEAWAHACRGSFLDGYIERSGDDVREHRMLLDAFELDKALYEAVYEARNRPAWLAIPTAAVRRLAARAVERG